MIFIYIALTAFICVVSYFIYKKSNKMKNMIKKSAIALAVILFFSIGLEVSLFNINFYKSHSYTPLDVSAGLGEYKADDGTYTLYDGDIIEIDDINKEIKNINIKLSENCDGTVKIHIAPTDEANKNPYYTPAVRLYPKIEKSQYINIHTSGESEKILIKFETTSSEIKIDSVTLNCNRPFEFNIARVIILFAILVFLYIFRPSSPIYDRKLSDIGDMKTILLTIFICLQCIVFIIVGTMNPAFLGITATQEGLELTELPMEHHNQYDELAQAILKGKVYIDNDDIPQSLKDMKNPYDTTERLQTQTETGDYYRWDVAYFDGHYYVYFGIVPLLLIYLPFRAIFDAPFPTAFGIIFVAVLFAIGIFKLLGLICEKYFNKTSVGAYLLLALATVNCCGAMFLVKRPDFYSLPIICSLAFVVWGIFLWLKGRDTIKFSSIYLLLGSLCCALAVGCRPQSVLMCAVAIPIFFDYFIKEKNILNKKEIKKLIVLAVPFVIVAGSIMYYNFIRFNSPFDFGSGYNLTTNDVTKRGFDIGRTGLGLFTYLFQTPVFTATFPYIRNVNIENAYVGKTIFEYCFGGLITCTPVLWSIFATHKVRNTLKEKKLYSLVVTLALIGFAMVIANTQAGGLLQRYYSDFGYIFFIWSVLVILSLYDKSNFAESTKTINTILLISTILSVVYTICLVFSVADGTIDTQNPTLFGKILHIIEFWR